MSHVSINNVGVAQLTVLIMWLIKLANKENMDQFASTLLTMTTPLNPTLDNDNYERRQPHSRCQVSYGDDINALHTKLVFRCPNSVAICELSDSFATNQVLSIGQCWCHVGVKQATYPEILFQIEKHALEGSVSADRCGDIVH